MSITKLYATRRIAPRNITEAPNKRSLIRSSFRKTPPRIIIKSVDNLKIDVA